MKNKWFRYLIYGLLLFICMRLFSPLRFENRTLGQLVNILVLWVVFSTSIPIFTLYSRPWVRVIGTAASVFIAILFPVLAFVLFITGPLMTRYNRIESIELEHSRVIAYTSIDLKTIGEDSSGRPKTEYEYWLEISQEMILLPGIILVKEVHKHPYTYPKSVKFNLLSAENLEIQLAREGFNIPEETIQATIFPYIYF